MTSSQSTSDLSRTVSAPAVPDHHAPTDFYHQLYHPSLPKWRPIVALITFIMGGLLINGIISGAAMIAQSMIDGTTMDVMRMTPLVFLGLNLSLAALIPLSVGIERLFFKGYRGTVSSSTGRLPWRRMGLTTLALVPIYLLLIVATWSLAPEQATTARTIGTYLMMLICLLTTPLQAAGEEVGFRGLLPRVLGAFTAKHRLALALAFSVPSVLFMLAHGAGDPWLNVYYLIFGVSLAVLAWRTGNIGASIVIHAVNNVAMMMSALIMGQDMSGMFDRSAGTGGPFLIPNMIFIPLLSAVLIVLDRRRRSA